MPRNAIRRAALLPRSGITLKDHVRIRFNESSGTSVAWTGRRNGADISGTITLGSAPTWTDSSIKAPSSNTTCHAVTSNATLIEALSPPQAGGLIFLWAYKGTVDTAGNMHHVLNWGHMGTNGGYAIAIYGAANTAVHARITGNGEATVGAAAIQNNSPTGWQTVAQYIKTTAGALQPYSSINGSWSGAQTTTAQAETLSATIAATFGVGLLVNCAAGPVAGTQYINKGASDTLQIAELWVFRDEDGSLYNEMGRIAADYHSAWRDKPMTLRDV